VRVCADFRSLSPRQYFEDIVVSCPLVALPSDVSRSKPIVKRTYARTRRMAQLAVPKETPQIRHAMSAA